MENSWVHKTLGELFVFKNGLNKGKEYFGYGTPIINYMDVYKHPAIKKKYVQGRVTLSHQELDRFRVLKGDVFFTRTSETPEEVGMSATLLEDIPNCSFSGFVLRARPLTDLLIPEYCVYAFTAKEIRASIIKNCTYTTRALTNGRVLASLKLPIPSLAEQQRIASALSDADALVTELDALIEKKRAIMAGTMQELLTGKRRLQGFSEPWVERTLEEICLRHDNLRIPVKASDRKAGYTPYYGANGIQDYVEGYTHDGESILIAEDGANDLDNYPVNFAVGKIWVNNHAHVVKAKEEFIYSYFLYLALKQCNFNDVIVGSSRAKLNASSLMQINVKYPSSLAEQRAIASILSDMDAEIAELEAKRDKYKEVRQGMMQQLLTGKIRLI